MFFFREDVGIEVEVVCFIVVIWGCVFGYDCFIVGVIDLNFD